MGGRTMSGNLQKKCPLDVSSTCQASEDGRLPQNPLEPQEKTWPALGCAVWSVKTHPVPFSISLCELQLFLPPAGLYRD